MPDVRRRARRTLVNVQIDDMRRGVHEHLEFGDGRDRLPAGARRSATATGGWSRSSWPGTATRRPRWPAARSTSCRRARERAGTGVAGTGRPAASRLEPDAVHRLFPPAERRGGPLGAPARAARRAARRRTRTIRGAVPTATRGERLAILRALPDARPRRRPRGRPLVQDALRTNDTRLVAAALGPYARRYLDDHAFRQAVLKCVFMAIPLAAVAGLDRRADAELARMLADYAAERSRRARRP